MKPRVLILNHPFVKCGVYQFGKRVYELAARSTQVSYFYRIVSDKLDYTNEVRSLHPDYIVYNWHWDRMPWLTYDDVASRPGIKHFFMWHDGSMFELYDKYLFFGAYDPGCKAVPDESRRVLLPRPLFDYAGPYPVNPTPVIGSFGFSFDYHRYPQLIGLVARSFKQAVVRQHFTLPYFGDKGTKMRTIIDQCQDALKGLPNITVEMRLDWMNDDELLTWLAGNDLNVFYYEPEYQNPGISAGLDYALSVRRPIAVTRNSLFRHVANEHTLIEESSLGDILQAGTAPLEGFYQDWSTRQFTKSMESLFL